MSTKSVSVRNFDLGFAAVCFACFLYVFGLGDSQTLYSKEAANYFAICIPILLSASMLMNVLAIDRQVFLGRYKKSVFYVLRAITLIAMLIGLLGIHSMFKCISEEAALLFSIAVGGCLLTIFIVYRLSLPGNIDLNDIKVD